MGVKKIFLWAMSLGTFTVSHGLADDKKPEIKRTVISFESPRKCSNKNSLKHGVKLSASEASAEAARSRLLSRMTANSQQALPE